MCNKNLFFNQIDRLKEFCNVVVPLINDFSNIAEAANFILDSSPEEFYLAGISFGGYV